MDNLNKLTWFNVDGSMRRSPFEQRFQQMRNDQTPWLEAWIDLRDYIKPTRGIFDGERGMSDRAKRGKKIDHSLILDGMPSRAARTLAAGLISGLTSPARPWFRLTLKNKDLMQYKPIKLYLAACEDRIYGAFSGSNVYGGLYSVYDEIGTFGTACMALLEDRETIIRTRPFTIGEYMIGCDYRGRINAFARVYESTVGQVVEEFGLDKVKTSTKRAWETNNRNLMIRCYHLILPNDFRDPTKIDNRNMPSIEVYYEEGMDRDKFLSVSGYESFPILAPRWDVIGNDTYGKGPGWDTLGDVKMLQKMQRDKLIALEKVIDPPMQADASVSGPVAGIPGGLTRSTATGIPNAGVRPAYEIQPDMNAIRQDIVLTQQAIREAYYADIFMMISNDEGPQMTAREIAERHEEKLMQLGPVLERLESELLDPLIERTFQILQRAQLLPPPPVELQNMSVDVQYISMLAQAQQMVGTQKLKEHVAFVGAMAQADPSALDTLDMDKAAQEHADMIGVAPDVVRSPDEIAQIRAQRQKAQQAAAAQQATESAAKTAQTLGKTPVGTNSALDKVIDNMGGDTSSPPGVDPNAPSGTS